MQSNRVWCAGEFTYIWLETSAIFFIPLSEHTVCEITFPIVIKRKKQLWYQISIIW